MKFDMTKWVSLSGKWVHPDPGDPGFESHFGVERVSLLFVIKGKDLDLPFFSKKK